MNPFTRIVLPVTVALVVASTSFAAPAKPASPNKKTAKPVAMKTAAIRPFVDAPHDNVTIEWWYVNSQITTEKGRHLALIGSFFRFGNGAGQMAKDSSASTPRSHYLIWAITDKDSKTHQAYSLADRNTLEMMKQFVTLRMLMNPNDTRASAMLDTLSKDAFPPPTVLLDGPATVSKAPFAVAFGSGDTLTPVAGKPLTYTVKFTDLKTGVVAANLQFEAAKPAMYVGGTGNTGLRDPEDMKYLSLTRCKVTGTVDTGAGPERITAADGWFDHQWGDTWTTQSAGWDWWGAQLADGTDILFFRQRDLATGKVFFPLATFMDKAGKLTVTKNIRFDEDLSTLWTSPATGVSYPLNWTVAFPDQHLILKISPDVREQEMPIITGGSIWEGSCAVEAAKGDGTKVGGTAYMELVGYNSPAVKRLMKAGAAK
ncbi:MAG TPA: lipocalin family protein [Capsulimonadaceae bacterium]|jgi:predicted secreted hydrolase